jgi:hypothetical protein
MGVRAPPRAIASEDGAGHVRLVIGAVEQLLPVGVDSYAAWEDDPHTKHAAGATCRWGRTASPLVADPAPPRDARGVDRLQVGRERINLRVVLAARPIVEDGAEGLKVLAVPLYCREPIARRALGATEYLS